MKKNILVFIAKGLDINRFKYGGLFKLLDKKYNLTIIIPDAVGARKVSDEIINTLSGYNVEMIPIEKDRINKWEMVHDLTCFKYSDEVSSYKVREEMLRRGAIGDHGFNLIPTNYHKSIRRHGFYLGSRIHLRNLLLNFKIEQSRKKYISKIDDILKREEYDDFIGRIENEIGINSKMDKIIEDHNPICVIYPTASYDVFFHDLLFLTSKKSVPLFQLQGSWDCLSSKYKMLHFPSLIGVWGKQGRDHGINIQKIESEKIKVIGAPHYEPLFKWHDKIKNDSSKNRKNKIYKCLFGGSLRPFDEIFLLKSIENAINDKILPSMEIIYRPHPYRMPRIDEENFNDFNWANIKLDPFVKDFYKRNQNESRTLINSKFHDIDHLYSLYKSVDIIITPMSTLLLESLICGIPVIPIAFGDEKNIWGADKVGEMTHFRELKSIENILWCRSKDELINKILLAIKKTEDINYKNYLRDLSEKFVVRDDSFLNNLTKVLDNFILE